MAEAKKKVKKKTVAEKKLAQKKATAKKNNIEEQLPPEPSKEPLQAPPSTPPAKPPAVTNKDLFLSIVKAFGSEGTDEQKNIAKAQVQQYLTQQAKNHIITATYNLIFLYDDNRMIQSDADKIYSAVTKFPKEKPILLVLHSPGGYIGPAYLIGKMLYVAHGYIKTYIYEPAPVLLIYKYYLVKYLESPCKGL